MPLFAVEILVDDEELPAIKRVGPRTSGPTEFDWFDAVTGSPEESVSEGVSGIRIVVDVDSADAARDWALHEYDLMREQEDLPRSDGLVLGTYVVDGEVARAEELLVNAWYLMEAHQFEMAIVTAQVACELEIRAAIESRISRLRDPLAKLARQKNRRATLLRDDVGEALFDAAFGVLPRLTFPRWSEYVGHVARRNAIVHRGAVAVEKDAQASRDVAIALVSWIRTEAPRAQS